MAVTYFLELFVVGHSAKAEKAEQNLRRLCEAKLAGRYELRITDVLEDDRIIVTPTLVRKSPGPTTWIAGTLAPNAALEHMLRSTLGRREP